MNNESPTSIAARHPSSNIGFSAVTVMLAAAMPKCPLCWMALVGALGAGSVINTHWLQPLVVALLFLPTSALFVRARRRRSYGPFSLGLIAAIVMYLCKFRLNYDIGVYLSGAALLGASVWNALPKRRAADSTISAGCNC